MHVLTSILPIHPQMASNGLSAQLEVQLNHPLDHVTEGQHSVTRPFSVSTVKTTLAPYSNGFPS